MVDHRAHRSSDRVPSNPQDDQDRRQALNEEEVHVWWASLDDLRPSINQFLGTLAEEELARARRFHFQKDREQYVLSRGLLREILSLYGSLHPCEFRFGYGPQGKPAMLVKEGGSELTFNLSHTQGAMICAVACNRELGVDLEFLHEDVGDPSLANRVLSPSEIAVLADLPTHERHATFLRYWTRKEAYVKARGEGLSFDLKSLNVLGHKDVGPRLAVEGHPDESRRWALVDLVVPAGYVAALVVEGDAPRVNYRYYS